MVKEEAHCGGRSSLCSGSKQPYNDSDLHGFVFPICKIGMTFVLSILLRRALNEAFVKILCCLKIMIEAGKQ